MKNYLNIRIPKSIIEMQSQKANIIIGDLKYDTELTELEITYINSLDEIGDKTIVFRPVDKIQVTFKVNKIKRK